MQNISDQKLNEIIDVSIKIVIEHLLNKKPEYQSKIIEIKKYLESLPRYQTKEKGINAAFAINDDQQYLLISESILNENDGFEKKTEQETIQIMVHELTHAISYFNSGKKIFARFEEGIADIISDSACQEYYQSKEFKETSYQEANTVIRSLALLNDEIIYSYLLGLNNNKNKLNFYDTMSQTLGEEKSKELITSELYSYNINSLMESEEKILSEILKEKINKDLINIPSLYIYKNKIIQELIMQKLKEEKIFTIEEIQKKYPNITFDFYENYKALLSENGMKYDYIQNELENDPEKSKKYIKEIVDDLIIKAEIDQIKEIPYSTTSAQKIYNAGTKTELAGKILGKKNIELVSIESLMIVNYLITKRITPEELLSQENSIMSQLGYDEGVLGKLFIETIKQQYDILKDQNPNQIIEIIKETHSENIEYTIILNYYTKKLKENNISIEEYKKIYYDIYEKMTSKNINIPYSLHDDYLLAIADYRIKHNNHIDYLFAMSLFNEIDKESKKVSIPGPITAKVHIARKILEKNPNVSLLYQILESNNLNIIGSSVLNSALLKIIIEDQELDMKDVEVIVNSYTSKNYTINSQKMMTRRNSFVYDNNKMLSILNNKSYQTLIEQYINGDKQAKKIIASEKFKRYDKLSLSPENKNSNNKLLEHEINMLEDNKIKNKLQESINQNSLFMQITNLQENTEPRSEQSVKEHMDIFKNTPYLKNEYLKNLLITEDNSFLNFFALNKLIEQQEKYKSVNEIKTIIDTRIKSIKLSLLDSINNKTSDTVNEYITAINYAINGKFNEEESRCILHIATNIANHNYSNAEDINLLLEKIEELLLVYPKLSNKIIEIKIHKLQELEETKQHQEGNIL